MPLSLLLATTSPGKLQELRALLSDLPVEIVGLKDVFLQGVPSVPETGETFLDNARIKAHAYAESAQLVTLADDSGLEVDALGGAPGVFSARYAGEQASDAENNDKLLQALSASNDRTARYRCALVLFDPWHRTEVVTEGVFEGEIGRAPRGTGGFGYDPLFELGDGRTAAELSPEEKNQRSHRGQASRAMREHIARLVERQEQLARAVMSEART